MEEKLVGYLQKSSNVTTPKAKTEPALAGIKLPAPLENKITTEINKAEKAAVEGDIKKTKYHILTAKKEAIKSNISLTKDEEKKIEESLKTAYENGIPKLLNEASKCATAGLISLTKDQIKMARKYATESGITLTPEQEDGIINNLKTVYQKNISEVLKEISRDAKNGYVVSAKFNIEIAEKYAKESVYVPLTPEQRKEIESNLKLAYQNGIPKMIEEASKAATRGSFKDARNYVQGVRQYQKELGGSLSVENERKIQKILAILPKENLLQETLSKTNKK